MLSSHTKSPNRRFDKIEKLKMKDSLFGESKSKSEIAIQTETSSRLKLTSRKRIRFHKDDNPLDE